MPGMDGVEATRRIAESSDARVLALTTFDVDQHVVDMLRAGAIGFLLKDVTSESPCSTPYAAPPPATPSSPPR